MVGDGVGASHPEKTQRRLQHLLPKFSNPHLPKVRQLGRSVSCYSIQCYVTLHPNIFFVLVTGRIKTLISRRKSNQCSESAAKGNAKESFQLFTIRKIKRNDEISILSCMSSSLKFTTCIRIVVRQLRFLYPTYQSFLYFGITFKHVSTEIRGKHS